MALRNQTRQALLELAKALLTPSSQTDSLPGSLVMIGPQVVPDSGSDEQMQGACLTDREADLYLRALHLLEQDEAVEHLKPTTLSESLSDFAYNVWSAPTQGSPSVRKRVEGFIASLARPLAEYDVAFTVDHITLGEQTLTVGEVQFQEFTREMAHAWGFVETNEHDKALLSEALGKVLGIVTVSAGTQEKAVERARQLLDRALSMLRVCCSFLLLGALYDESLLQKRGQFYIVRNRSQERNRAGVGWQRGFSPLDLHLTEKTGVKVAESIASLESIHDGTIANPLRDALLRSLEWIGTSTTREQYDHKVVDLCTALESVLTTLSDRRKGEAVALRSMLLSIAVNAGFTHPGRICRLYEMRSRIVHGSEVGMCGKADCVTLYSTARKAVWDAIALNAMEGTIKRPYDLVQLLETPDRVQAAADWLRRWDDPDSGRVLDYAEQVLAGNSSSNL